MSGLLVGGARPALAAAGDLDPSFDADGVVVSDMVSFVLASMAVQSDGKIVVAGVGPFPNSQPQQGGLVVARFLPDGRLDSSFGTSGVVYDQAGVGPPLPRAMVIQTDGKILVGGSRESGPIQTFQLARYTSDGHLDTGFGSGGTVSTQFTGGGIGGFPIDALHALALQPDGKIVAAGRSGTPCLSFAPFTCSDLPLVARYNPDGSLDTSFASGGKLIGPGGPAPCSTGRGRMVLQGDGKIVMHTGAVYPGTRLLRFNPNGSADTSFGTSGARMIDDVTNPELALQSDGKLVLAGQIQSSPCAGANVPFGGFVLVRQMPDGSRDTSFGSGGSFTAGVNGTSSVESPTGVVVQADGKIVVGGGSSQSGFTLVRFSTGGSPDNTFGTAGQVVTSGSSSSLILGGITRLALAQDGKLVAIGQYIAYGASFPTLARYQTSGGGGVGGKGFSIAPQPGGISLNWRAGADQASYLLARSPSASWPLPAATTSYTDATTAAGINCYQLFALGASSVLANSDALCAQLGVRSPSGAPPGFTARLNQSTTAALTWESPGDELGFVLVVLKSGQQPRTDIYGPWVKGAFDQTDGTLTCYVLYAVYTSGLGNTDLICAVPGQSAFGTASPAVQSTAARGAPTTGTRTVQNAGEPAAGRAAAAQQNVTTKLPAARGKIEEAAAQLRSKGGRPAPKPSPAPQRGR